MQLSLTAVTPWAPRAPGEPVPPRRLVRYLTEAFQDSRFEALWLEGGEGRAYAAACLSLARPRRRDAAGRRALYDAIVTRRRRELLFELSGVMLPTAALHALARVAWPELTYDGWRRLLRLLSGVISIRAPMRQPALPPLAARARAPLLRLTRLGPVLGHQLPHIPAPLRTPALLALADRYRVPEQFSRLSEQFARAAPEGRAALAAQAASVRARNDLQALFERAADAARDATPFIRAPNLGPRLVRLGSVAEMRHEGRAMRNCLGTHHLDRAAYGEGAYYRWIGNGERASVSLVRVRGGWALDELAGYANSRLSPETEEAIRRDVAEALASRAT